MASAAPGTAGVQMAMMSLTSGLAFKIVLVSSNAFFCRSSQGRSAAMVICGYFSCRRASMVFCQAIMLAAVSEAVMMAKDPLPPRMRAALSMSVWPIPSGVAWLTKKSRASGSASASQVRTVIPRWRAFREHRRDSLAVLDGDGDDVDAAGDPGVDHFVLLGGVGVGRSVPDELDTQLCAASSAPLRQAMK